MPPYWSLLASHRSTSVRLGLVNVLFICSSFTILCWNFFKIDLSLWYKICRICHFLLKREVSWILPSLDSRFDFSSCIWFDLFIFEVSKATLFKIEKFRGVFLSLLMKKLSKMSFWVKYFRSFLHLVFLFGIFHIKEKINKYMHLNLSFFLVCVWRNYLGKFTSVCSLLFVWKNCNLLSLVARIFISQNKQRLIIIVDCILGISNHHHMVNHWKENSKQDQL